MTQDLEATIKDVETAQEYSQSLITEGTPLEIASTKDQTIFGLKTLQTTVLQLERDDSFKADISLLTQDLPVLKKGIQDIEVIKPSKYSSVPVITPASSLSLTPKRDYKTITKPVLQFGSEGPQNDQFDRPFAVCTDQEGNIFVADCANHRIQIFSP